MVTYVKTPLVLTIFSDPIPTLTLTTSGALDPPVPSIIVPASFLPALLTIKRVELILMWRKLTNTNAALNKLSGTQYVQIQKAAGALANAILFVDDMLNVPAAADGPGDAIVGSIDVKATVDSDNATYNMQWTNALTDQDSIILYDVRTALRFYMG